MRVNVAERVVLGHSAKSWAYQRQPESAESPKCGKWAARASMSQAKQKPQATSPGVIKEVAPLICPDLNQGAHTKELALPGQLYS